MKTVKKLLSIMLVLGIICVTATYNRTIDANAAAANGIKGNGTGGISIDINASPYTDFANISNWGQYAYGPEGCAWFASARVKQLTGKGNMIYSGSSWYNSAGANLGFSRGSTLQAPAIVCWSGHVAILEKVSGSTAYISEGGSTYYSDASHGYCVIRAVDTGRLASLNSGFLGYVYLPSGGGAPQPPQNSVYYSNISVEFVDNWNAGLYGRIENPNRRTISGVGVHVWDSAGNLVVDHAEGCGLNTSFVEQRLNIVAEALPSGLQSGETYTFEMFAGVDGTNVLSSKGSFTCVDSEKPVITDVKVYDVGQDGYTVSCKATDNFKVDRVQFPTWTLENAQDDLPGDWQTNSLCRGTQNGDIYTFRVNRSDHNNERGVYCTHIYAWDKAGNVTSVAIDDVMLEKDNEQVVEPTKVPASTPIPSADSSTSKSDSQSQRQGTVVTPETNINSGGASQSIIVPQVRGLSLKNQKGRKVKCSWKKVNGASFYSVQVALNRSFTKGNKGIKVFETKYTKFSLKKKKTYYVRVRAWRYIRGRGYVAGNWSAVKKVKIKK